MERKLTTIQVNRFTEQVKDRLTDQQAYLTN